MALLQGMRIASDRVAAGEYNPDFQGYHRMERMLYRDGITSGANDFTPQGLVAWIRQLNTTYVALGQKLNMVR